jgi:hypothetical protein
MCNMKCFVTPVITGTTGIVSTGLRNVYKQYQGNVQYILYKNTITHHKESVTV